MKITKNDIVGKKEVSTNKIWEGLVGFAAYSFNKSHAIAYSQISYQTAKLYRYRWQEYMEYHLNNSKKSSTALEHLVEQGYKTIYPTYKNMNGDHFKVFSNRERVYKDGTKFTPEDPSFVETKDYSFTGKNGNIRQILIPGREPKNYDNLLDALFLQETRATAFLKGVFDSLTMDRSGLLDLVNALTRKQAEKMMFSQVDNNSNLEEILSQMKIAGIVDTYEKDNQGGYHIEIFPFRGTKNKVVEIRSNYDPQVFVEDIEYDMKYFKSIRNGLLGKAPTEYDRNARYWDSFFKEIERRRNRANTKYGEGWFDDKQMARKWNDLMKQMLRERLEDPKYKETSSRDPKVKEPIRAMIESVSSRGYSSGTRVDFKFSDKSDFFYVPNEMADKLRNLKKNSVVDVLFVFSPFVKLRSGDVIMDYDVLHIKNLENGEVF